MVRMKLFDTDKSLLPAERINFDFKSSILITVNWFADTRAYILLAQFGFLFCYAWSGAKYSQPQIWDIFFKLFF